MAGGDYNGITKACDEGFYGVSRNLVGIYFMRLFVIPCTSVRNFMYGLYGRQK